MKRQLNMAAVLLVVAWSAWGQPSPQTPSNPDVGWTTDTLREYVLKVIDERTAQTDQQFRAVYAAISAQDRQVQAALDASDKAILKAEAALQDRLESVNEFRGTLSDQARLQFPRAEAESQLRSLSLKIEDITTRLTTIDGRSAGLTSGWQYLVAGIGLLVMLFGVWMAVNKARESPPTKKP